jgi:hypothetical protein
MSWLTRLGQHLHPGLIHGVVLADWLRLLWDNRFRVGPRFWPKAAVATALSLGNTPLRALEALAYGRRVAATKVPPPLFILGHWRSGTTFLHDLLAKDRRFAYMTFAQTLAPHGFLLAGRIVSRVTGWLLPPTRGQLDNVAVTAESPQEEEFALCRTSCCSPYLAWTFPGRSEHYYRYLTFRDVPRRQVQRWQSAFVLLAQKLTWLYRRPLVFKSPPNTARIRLLLDVFPDARFVHIRRNPYSVYQSTLRMNRVAGRAFAFQGPRPADLHRHTLRAYQVMYDAFFEERPLIPAGRLCEVAYEELAADPVNQMRRIYEELSLPDFESARPALEAYTRSLIGYKKNEYPELPADLRAEVGREWRRSFEEWKYPFERPAGEGYAPCLNGPPRPRGRSAPSYRTGCL